MFSVYSREGWNLPQKRSQRPKKQEFEHSIRKILVGEGGGSGGSSSAKEKYGFEDSILYLHFLLLSRLLINIFKFLY